MLRRMRKQLAEIIPPSPEEIEVDVRCRSGDCGRLLGTYPFNGDLLITDRGERLTVRVGPRRRVRPGRKISRQGAARFTSEFSPDGHYVTLSWRCGCGATPERRSDRWGRLEVSYIKGRPSVHIS